MEIRAKQKPLDRFLLCIAVVALCPVAAVADTVVSIEPPNSGFALNKNFSLRIFVSDVSDLFAYQFDLGFDPKVLSATSVSEGSFLRDAGPTFFVPGTIDNKAGTISFTADTLLGSARGFSVGGGTLATANFKAISTGISPVTLSDVTLLDSKLSTIDSAVEGGTVSVTPVAPVPEPATLTLLSAGLIAVALTCHSAKRSRARSI